MCVWVGEWVGGWVDEWVGVWVVDTVKMQNQGWCKPKNEVIQVCSFI